MDFGSLPPEINSARMYSGPGSGSMLAAAAAWGGLAAELHTAAAGYQSAASQLISGPWRGPASASMAAAAAPYVAWLRTTAIQAEQAATQARAAAGAYESARAMTVPPLVIAANRRLQMSLVATNVLGQNTPAIAATEFHYGQMWAQDAAAMYGYAASSAAASKVTPFALPPATSNPSGLASIQATLSQLTPAIPVALQQLASPSGSVWDGLVKLRDDLDLHLFARWGSTITSVISTGKSLMPAAKAVESAVKASGSALGGGLGSLLGLGSAGWGGAGGPAVTAGLGRAASIGALSVPQSWAAAVPTMSSAATALPGSGGWNTLPVSGPAGPAGVPVMPITGMAGRGAGGLADASRLLPRPNMVPRWPVGG
jgi:PPE-repeat protein